MIRQYSTLDGVERSAILSNCGKFRYELTRTWAPKLRRMIFVMLNPSTADGMQDDHTIRKCVQFAKLNNCGGIVVYNLYAYRATSPTDLKKAGWPIGPKNWEIIQEALLLACRQGDTVVCAWGRNAANRQEPHTFLVFFRDWMEFPLYALKRSADGTPHHPLMLPYSSKLEPMT